MLIFRHDPPSIGAGWQEALDRQWITDRVLQVAQQNDFVLVIRLGAEPSVVRTKDARTRNQGISLKSDLPLLYTSELDTHRNPSQPSRTSPGRDRTLQPGRVR